MSLLEEKIKGLPDCSGVYIMRDFRGEVIYVGKAVILSRRVRSYFQNGKKHPKVQAMADVVADFDYIITLCEKDALTLENNLIKKYKPKYNILLKDDKTSPFIKIDLSEKFPTIEVTRKVKKDGAKYFGPYLNGINVWDIVAVIKSAYGVRACPKKLGSKKRECLNYHIGLCFAPCIGRIDENSYAEKVKSAIDFLNGKDSTAGEILEEKMLRAAESEQFEQAIFYREKLEMLKRMKERTIGSFTEIFDLDAFAFVGGDEYACISVCIVRGGNMMGVKNFVISDTLPSESESIESFIRQYYSGSNTDLPREIALPFDREDDGGALKEYLFSLKGVNTVFVAPKKGVKKKLLETAKKNAEDYLFKAAEKTKREHDMTVGAATRLAEILGLKSVRRMECYDISNISGVDKVASMAVFIDGKKASGEYRRFKIRTVEGANDFMSMNETIRRRFSRAKDGDGKFSELPDLIVIDGGKSQLSAAYGAMSSEGFDVPMIGLAKREEEVFTVFDNAPIILPKSSYPLKLLQRIRDEAHRYAITYHRNLRSKRYRSRLEDIKGIGAVRRAALLKKYGSLENMREASIAELASVDGMDTPAAESVYAFLHSEE